MKMCQQIFEGVKHKIFKTKHWISIEAKELNLNKIHCIHKVNNKNISTLDILDECMLHSNIDMKQPIDYKSLRNSKFIGRFSIKMHFHNQPLVFSHDTFHWIQDGHPSSLHIPQKLKAFGFQNSNKVYKFKKLVKAMNEKSKKDCNVDSMQNTKGNLDNRTTSKLV
jgi:hypothetical protein